jgi:hypothetical protein
MNGKFHYFQIDCGFKVVEETNYPGEAPEDCTGDCFVPFFEATQIEDTYFDTLTKLIQVILERRQNENT